MIAIVNVSKNLKLKGRQTYSLRINNKEICRFFHNREESLDVCLEKAAKAFRLANIQELSKYTKYNA